MGGVSRADLVEIRRELFVAALDVARHDYDPSVEWDRFCEAAWGEAALAFGFIEREEVPGVGITGTENARDAAAEPPDTPPAT